MPRVWRKTPGPDLANLFLLGLPLGEDDLVDEEEDNHGNAAIQDRGADVIQPRGNEVPGHGHPDAVDGVNHTGDDAERDDVPHALPGDVSLTPEHPAPLDEEVDDLANDHGNHVGGEVGNAPLIRAVADDVPLEVNAEQRQVNAGETKVPGA